MIFFNLKKSLLVTYMQKYFKIPRVKVVLVTTWVKLLLVKFPVQFTQFILTKFWQNTVSKLRGKWQRLYGTREITTNLLPARYGRVEIERGFTRYDLYTRIRVLFSLGNNKYCELLITPNAIVHYFFVTFLLRGTTLNGDRKAADPTFIAVTYMLYFSLNEWVYAYSEKGRR